MTVDATIPIGSNSKMFTTVAIYQLQEQGLLNLRAEIAEYLDQSDFEAMGLEGVETYCPKLANATADDPCEKITLRNLLNMFSGIYPTLNCEPSPSNPLCEILPYVANPGSFANFVATFILLPLQFQPGTAYMYVCVRC
jgi:CubicO group peptidase (beta-lactamase class C family)